jgi:hypothetical protein
MAIVGIGTVRIAGIGGSACVGSPGVGSSAIGLALTTLVWYRCEPQNTFGGCSPLVESCKVGCIGSAGDMGKVTVLSLFAASALGDELVTHGLVVSYCRAGMKLPGCQTSCKAWPKCWVQSCMKTSCSG